MKKLSPILHGNDRHIAFWCPGCEEAHYVPVSDTHNPGVNWGYNGDPDRPTLTPSILIRSGHYIPGHEDKCWCKYNADQVAKGDDPSGFSCGVCHSFVTDGSIQFLNDCTHPLAGQTVPLPEWEP